MDWSLLLSNWSKKSHSSFLGERGDLRWKKEANRVIEDPERGELPESLSNPILASSDLDRVNS